MIKLLKFFSVFFLIMGVGLFGYTQSDYWVFFTDKQGTSFNPYDYFDSKAIERRVIHGISLYDSTDYPLNQTYVKAISDKVTAVNFQSRWFNAVAVNATSTQIAEIMNLAFVKQIRPVQLNLVTAGVATFDYRLNADESELIKNQLNHMQGNLFIANGISGKGVRIAVFDAGFPSVDKNPVFEHIITNNRIIATYDFARKRDYVYAFNTHGTMVLSCIAGKIDTLQLGLATDAEFLLARTEIESEVYSEEENWLAAAEWADKLGADIINSSLGYTYHRYFPFEMDGNISLVAKAASLASNKGILVINAMGNDGNKDWKILATPADADSVLSIGGINPSTNLHADFSSFGPSADFRLKPNLVAFGTAVVANRSKLAVAQGTSFATPLVTGFAACVLQLNPLFTNMQLKNALQESGSLYPYADYAHGYGIPQASYFVANNIKLDSAKTYSIILNNNIANIQVNNEFLQIKQHSTPGYLYVNIKNQNKQIIKYWVIEVFSKDVISLDLTEFEDAESINVFYKGYYNAYKLK